MWCIAVINGRAWEWMCNGWTYQALHLTGTNDVKLFYLDDKGNGWHFGHSREIPPGKTAAEVAREIYVYITEGN